MDEDCDPSTPDIPPPCSTTAKVSGVTALDLAAAMELCTVVDPQGPLADLRWGILSAELRRSDGAAPSPAQLADFQDQQAAVLTAYGSNTPRRGATFAVLSTGRARDAGHPDFAPPQPGTSLGWDGSPPADFLAKNGGSLPTGLSCPGACPTGNDAEDGIALRLQVRTPTNANVMTTSFRFFTAEFPAHVCTGPNDFFLGLVTSSFPQNIDQNIAWSGDYPTSVNNQKFHSCQPFGCSTCPGGQVDLLGTGMTAATDWAEADMFFVSGEVITLDLHLFDVADGNGDSRVLIDDIRWGYKILHCPHP